MLVSLFCKERQIACSIAIREKDRQRANTLLRHVMGNIWQDNPPNPGHVPIVDGRCSFYKMPCEESDMGRHRGDKCCVPGIAEL